MDFSNSEESTIIRDNIKKLLSNYSSNDYLLKYDEYKLDLELFKELKSSAMALGSAFQKVNFLRDYKADLKELNRTYFPNLVNKSFDDAAKKKILNEIKDDFAVALKGIYMLPNNSKFGVYAAYKYYKRLLKKLDKTSTSVIKNKRVRVPNYQKVDVLARSYVRYRLNIL